ncbi:MAG: hypothetical protein F6K26_48030 [Moorea sp. SIO2I5]|nr:hypothetical protein [Moorena sp. SIO2I5]
MNIAWDSFPVLRRIYVPVGDWPIAHVNGRFEWLWLYAFAHPCSGETKAWILPNVNTELFNRVWAEFAAEFNNGDDKHIVLVVDQAGWHTSKGVELPEGLHLIFLPSHSPPIATSRKIMDSG